MVDQVATKVITVPMCLRGKGTKGMSLINYLLCMLLIFFSLKGFPPADRVVRDWLNLLAFEDCNVVVMKVHGFIASLFTVTTMHLKNLSTSSSRGVSWYHIHLTNQN
jgi:hypothetical protein